MKLSNQNPWIHVYNHLRQHSAGMRLSLAPADVPHPLDAEMSATLFAPAGQRAEYRVDLENGDVLAVADYGSHYETWIEPAHQIVRLEQMLQEAPGSSVVGMVAIGALAGLAIGQSRESALTGALIGGIAGLAGVGIANAKDSPELAEAAAALLNSLPRQSTRKS